MYRYIGNKTKLLPIIINKINEIVPKNSTIVDLMAGTGSVSLELRKEGYKVIASDVMTYSKHHLVVQLLMNNIPEFSGLILNNIIKKNTNDTYREVLDYLNSLEPKVGYFYKEFSPDGTPENGCPSRKYFTSSNAKKIDAIREEINTWICNNWITPNEESLLKHTLIMAVNDVANISGTYGYFLSEFSKCSLSELEMKPFEICGNNNIDNVVLQGYAENISKSISADLCYIDPPYIKRQYAANYHILETIARGDYPEAIGKSGLRNWWDQHSKLCTKTGIRDSFSKIIENMNCDKFLISYSEDGLLTINELIELFSKFGDVTVDTIEYSRFKSNKSQLSKEIIEYLIYLQKK